MNIRDRALPRLESVLGAQRTATIDSRYITVRRQVSYRLSSGQRELRRRMREFEGRHAQETCAIIGNGPSLRSTDLNRLADIPTFSLNRLYLMFDEMPFHPTYHVVVNKHVVDQCAEELRMIQCPLFTVTRNLSLLGPYANAFPSLPGPRFDVDPLSGLWEGGTVTFVAMQLAFFMGFRRVLLVGVDHSFKTQGKANELVESAGDDVNHFSPAYFGKGFRWQLPDLETSEVAYALARANFQMVGREIVDCTVGGKCDIFRKSSLASELS